MKSLTDSRQPSAWLNPTFRQETILQLWHVVNQLTDELSCVQHRLGTKQEQADDLSMAQRLGHEICNKVQVIQMLSDLEQMGAGAIAGPTRVAEMDLLSV